MKSQQAQLEALLSAEGWRIADRERPSSEWWLDELWTLESTWTPVGLRIFVSFLVDPQAPSPRSRGEHVWAVGVTRTRPQARQDVRDDVPLQGHWERDNRMRVVEQLRLARDRAAKEQAG